MPIYWHSPKKRWRFTFLRRIRGRRYRASKLLPAGWSRERADAFDRQETARLYALATGQERRDPLISEAVDLYRAHRTKNQKAGKKADRHLAALIPYYKDRHLSELPEIARTFADGQRDALAPDTIHNRLAYLKAACRYAWKHHNLTEQDPTQKMEIPSAGKGRQVYVTVPELNRLLRKFTDKEAAALARMAFYTGLRWIADLLPRTPDDIRRLDGELWIYVGDTKNGTPRMVPVHPAIRKDLRRLPFTRNWRDYYKEFEDARKKAGMLHVRMHDLRHSLASEIISSGGTLADVQAALHHKDAASAKRYAHLYPDRLRRIMRRVGR